MLGCDACSSDWVHCSAKSKWCLMHEETFCDVILSADAIEECQRYLPDPLQQASIDLARMSVCCEGQAVRSLPRLRSVVPGHQLHVVAGLCTQVLFGRPYEFAMEGLPIDVVVCERTPPSAARISLIRSSQGSAEVIGLVASKSMQAKYVSEIECDKYMHIHFKIEIDLQAGGHCLLHIHHGPFVY